MRKKLFADNSRVEPTIFMMEKLSFSIKLFSGHFYGQSFIKTVRGPCPNGFAPLNTIAARALDNLI